MLRPSTPQNKKQAQRAKTLRASEAPEHRRLCLEHKWLNRFWMAVRSDRLFSSLTRQGDHHPHHPAKAKRFQDCPLIKAEMSNGGPLAI